MKLHPSCLLFCMYCHCYPGLHLQVLVSTWPKLKSCVLCSFPVLWKISLSFNVARHNLARKLDHNVCSVYAGWNLSSSVGSHIDCWTLASNTDNRYSQCVTWVGIRWSDNPHIDALCPGLIGGGDYLHLGTVGSFVWDPWDLLSPITPEIVQSGSVATISPYLLVLSWLVELFSQCQVIQSVWGFIIDILGSHDTVVNTGDML